MLLEIDNLRTYFRVGLTQVAQAVDGISLQLDEGKTNLQAIWILVPTFVVLTGALTLLTFVGDGIRNAFDPRKAAN